jgi:hypothetical protein
MPECKRPSPPALRRILQNHIRRFFSDHDDGSIGIVRGKYAKPLGETPL